jgi:uncharacterized OB-fold protein
MASTALTAGSVAPMRQRQTMEFPYKHSTGETVGRFLAGLKEQKRIWGQRVSGQGVVVPPLGYSEVDASAGGEWVEVQNIGVVTAAARVDHPIARLHPSATPFVFVLVKLDGADTALAHFVKDEIDRVAVGARVEAVWAPDEARVGSIRDIACFRVIADAPPPKPKPAAAKPQPAPKVAKPAAKSAARKPAKAKPAAKAVKSAKKVAAAKPTKSAKTAKRAKRPTTAKKTRVGNTTKARKKGPTKKKPTVAKKARKAVRAKAAKPARAKARKPPKPSAAKKQRTVRNASKNTNKRPRRR